MASSIQILRSSIAKERPFPGNLLDGQPAINTNQEEPGLFFKASDGTIVKFGPAAITSDGNPPNTGGVGQLGNTIGELWLDKSVNPPILKVYDGTQWVNAGSGGGGGAGTFVRWIYTAIGGETSLSGVSAGVPLQYQPGLEEVFINGVLITRGTDYNAVNGSSIINLQPLTAGDVVTVTSVIPLSIVQLPGQVTLLRWSTLATAGQTVLSGSDSTSQQLVYTAGLEEVYVNGAFLRRGVDYTATNGSTITISVPLTLNDEITVLAWAPFLIGSQIVNADVDPNAGITYGKLNLAGGIVNADVNASAGITSNKLSFTQSGIGAVSRSVDSRLKDVVSVKDFGAKGDNFTDDTAAIQAAIDAVEAVYRGVVLFPQGLYRISTSLRLPSFVTLRGETKEGCWITNQGAPLNAPHVVNKDPSNFIFAAIENLAFLFGQYGLKIDVTGEVAGLRLTNVAFEIHTEASFYCNQLLQTSTFINCAFASSKYGVKVAGFTSNANNFINCGFLLNTEACLDLYISEVNTFTGCRFEGAGSLGRPTIKVFNAKALSFKGCYFEASNEILLQETGSQNSVSFDDCHFTGAGGGLGWTKYIIDSDGVVNFGNNNWGAVPSDATNAKLHVTGINNSITTPLRQLGSKDTTFYINAVRPYYTIVSPVVACPNLTRAILRAKRFSVDGSLLNLGFLTGTLRTNLFALEAGGFENVHTGLYRVTFRFVGATVISVTTQVISEQTIAGAVTATLSAASTQDNATLSITFSNVNPPTQVSSVFQWDFQCLTTCNTRNDILIPEII